MNAIERDELLLSLGESRRSAAWRGLSAWARALDPLVPAGRWRLRLSAAAPWEGAELDFVPDAPAQASAELAAALGARGAVPAGRSPEALGWLGARWDARAGRLEECFLRRATAVGAAEAAWRGGRRAPDRALARLAWAKTRFDDATLAERFRVMARLCPPAESWARDGAEPEWGLRLERPEPWPRFLRLDAAPAFGEETAAVSLLLLSRRVEEFGYRGGAGWVRAA